MQADEVNETYNYAKYLWDGKNNAGNHVSSGVYIYVTTDKYGSLKKGKIAILR